MNHFKRLCISLSLLVFLPCALAAAQGAQPACTYNTVSAQDRADIMNLFTLYSIYVDQREAEAYASVYTPDGSLSYPTESGQRRTIKGHDALVASVKEWRGKDEPNNIHAIYASAMVQVAPNHIRAMTPVIVGHLDPNKLISATHYGQGIYIDDIMKTPQGWKIQKREAHMYTGVPIPPEFLPCRSPAATPERDAAG